MDIKGFMKIEKIIRIITIIIFITGFAIYYFILLGQITSAGKEPTDRNSVATESSITVTSGDSIVTESTIGE